MSDSRASHLDRRSFLIGGAVIGAGLYVGIRLAQNRFDHRGSATGQVFKPNAFLRITPDDTVTVIIGKSEMGQGVYTGLAMAAAEELDIDPARVKVEFAPADPAFNTPFAPVQFTGGSMSTSTTYMPLREAGARARAMLVAAAASHWSVAPESLRTENGQVFNGSKSLRYGALADAASKEPVPEKVSLKDPAQFRYLGKPHKRLDSPMKVDGSAKFGIDQRIPGMLFAVAARPPVIGATLERFDDRAARAVSGVVDVKSLPFGVVVFASNTWAAKRGREALVLQWNDGPNKNLSTAGLREEYQKLAKQPGAVAAERGNVGAALAGAAKRMDVEYELPYLAHSPMEPLNCLADVRADGCDLYLGTQMQSPDRDAVAEVLGVDPATVKVHTAFLGGGFGRRAQRYSDAAVQAAEASRAVGKPVLLTQTREDDVQGLSYRPYVISRVRAGVDGEGNAVAWQQCIISQPVLRGGRFESFIPKGSAFDPSSVEGASDMPYTIPNLLVDTHEGNRTVPVLWWRSVGHSHTGFTVNCAMDELAALAGVDPVEYRRRLLGKDARFLAVLDKAAAMSNGAAPCRRATAAASPSRIPSAASSPRSPRCRSRAARCACTRCGVPSIAASPRILPAWSRRWKAPSTTGSRRHCTARSPSRTAACSRATSTTTRCCASTRPRRSRWPSSIRVKRWVAPANPARRRSRRPWRTRSSQPRASGCDGCRYPKIWPDYCFDK